MAQTRRKAGAKRRAGRKRASRAKGRRTAGTRRAKSAKARQAARRGTKARRQGSRTSRSRSAVGARGGEVAVLLVGTIPTASLEDLESESELARRDAESMVGEELPGGTVAVPEQDSVDEFAGALGVERSPDAPLRGSAEILDRRDRRRGGRKPSPTL